MSTQPGPAVRFQPTGIPAFDQSCHGLAIGSLTQVTGKHAIDVDLFIDALKRSNPEIVVLDAEYDTVTKKYRSVIEALRELHVQAKTVIIRCSPPAAHARDLDGEEALEKAVALIAKIYPQPVVLAWRGRPGGAVVDLDVLEVFMASSNIAILINARRDDEDDDYADIAHSDMIGDLVFDVAYLGPQAHAVECLSLSPSDFA